MSTDNDHHLADADALRAFGLRRELGVVPEPEPPPARVPSLAEAVYPHLVDNRERNRR
jgi:hypothetical protein